MQRQFRTINHTLLLNLGGTIATRVTRSTCKELEMESAAGVSERREEKNFSNEDESYEDNDVFDGNLEALLCN